MRRKKILCVFGTRPEAIKMAPVIKALQERSREFRVRVVVTAQHRHLLDQVLSLFRIRSHHDLNIMGDNQSLTDVSVKALGRLEPVFRRERPDMVLVHGDTSTSLFAALAAIYQKIPVGHVEAGLRSYDAQNPFPEEVNRRLTDALCELHFAPTPSSRRNLLKENIPRQRVFVTGNTVIDSLRFAIGKIRSGAFPVARSVVRAAKQGPFVLITAHRRENFGLSLQDICKGIKSVARARRDVRFLYPVHPNPHILGPVRRILGREPNVRLFPPLDYAEFLHLMDRCLFVVTDSGGLQEEAPSLGKPVLVLRQVTERPEAVKAGAARVIGTNFVDVKKWITRLLDDQVLYRKMATTINPYGDGQASQRIVQGLQCHFGFRSQKPKEFGLM